MTSALIFLLFILNAILIFAVVLLYMRQNRLMEIEKAQKKMQAETEEFLTSFLVEMKEENQLFMSKVADFHTSQQTKAEDLHEMNNEGHVKSEHQLEEHQPSVKAKNYTRMQAEKAYHVNAVEQSGMKESEGELDILSDTRLFADQVESLQAEGLSIEEIAQRLNKGKTEVSLALKFKMYS
ncbi:hypothetical protein [Bacillus sp. SD088]|uniref:hypothetical protein n=1 Tax=Bacillus sp. SD088 TaxID=2782012 RepID=UPI001A957641|nr:hypothetical protein [Bacillus sp. SD088]MBO0995416.1 hypothetical protein [Bacillus sp. SD088]